MSTSDAGNGAPSDQISPEEAARVRASVSGKEQAPGTRQQASVFQNWREEADRLGSPFEVEKIPISKLRQMRRDPMLGFGLNFIKTPHVRAQWFIDARSASGPSAQIAAHLDNDLRWIYRAFILQWMNALDFGFQPIAKRFEFRMPGVFYIETNPDTGEQQELPVWSEGNVEPIAWKTFMALDPELCMPIWKGDEFDGINYEPKAGPEGEEPKKYDIDLYHSLWVTNERDQNFESIWGYPRLGYAYRYWWSYWFRWAIADRAFERKADPSVVVFHPEGEYVNERTGQRMDYSEYALAVGERMRSGGVLSIPSEPYEDINGRGTMRQWDVDFTKDAVNFEPFDKSFDYIDVQKLRALWIPEQAFLEGKGGTSSRNVASELGESFIESQAVLSAQIAEHINRWMIPQWLAVNYPEFVDDHGKALIRIQGFADQDVEFTKQIIQLIGQQDTGMQEILKLVDLEQVLRDAGTPIASFAEQQLAQQEIEAQQQALQAPAGPPLVAPIPGAQVGVAPSPVSGFNAYIQPPDRIVLQMADNAAEFVTNLPDAPQYEDRLVKSYARQIWSIYSDLYKDDYKEAVEAIRSIEMEPTEFADFSDYVARANAMLRRWTRSLKWPTALRRTKDLYTRLANRAAKLELGRAKTTATLDPEEREQWIEDHIATFAAQVAETTHNEVRDFIAKRMQEMDEEEGGIDTDKLANEVADHFVQFPAWKSDRLARTEVRDVYNSATLMAAEAANARWVQAQDALFGEFDEECPERDGKLFEVERAWDETEHPNGTLGWKIVPLSLKIERAPLEEHGAEFDEDEQLLTLSDDLDDKAERAVLREVVDRITA